jgi:hypothetical protein
LRIILDVDPVGPRHPQIVIMDQCIISESHLARDHLDETAEVVHIAARSNCLDEVICKIQQSRCNVPLGESAVITNHGSLPAQ